MDSRRSRRMAKADQDRLEEKQKTSRLFASPLVSFDPKILD
ncbi:hypothetical protein [Ammoniphilus oxalaticus]|nr:hypothetical protein [Ammoniphilus oxalaticus]